MRVHGITCWGEWHGTLKCDVKGMYVYRILKGKCLNEYPGLKVACDDMFSKNIRSPLLLGVLVDMYQEQGGHTHLTQAAEVCV